MTKIINHPKISQPSDFNSLLENKKKSGAAILQIDNEGNLRAFTTQKRTGITKALANVVLYSGYLFGLDLGKQLSMPNTHRERAAATNFIALLKTVNPNFSPKLKISNQVTLSEARELFALAKKSMAMATAPNEIDEGSLHKFLLDPHQLEPGLDLPHGAELEPRLDLLMESEQLPHLDPELEPQPARPDNKPNAYNEFLASKIMSHIGIDITKVPEENKHALLVLHNMCVREIARQHNGPMDVKAAEKGIKGIAEVLRAVAKNEGLGPRMLNMVTECNKLQGDLITAVNEDNMHEVASITLKLNTLIDGLEIVGKDTQLQRFIGLVASNGFVTIATHQDRAQDLSKFVDTISDPKKNKLFVEALKIGRDINKGHNPFNILNTEAVRVSGVHEVRKSLAPRSTHTLLLSLLNLPDHIDKFAPTVSAGTFDFMIDKKISPTTPSMSKPNALYTKIGEKFKLNEKRTASIKYKLEGFQEKVVASIVKDIPIEVRKPPQETEQPGDETQFPNDDLLPSLPSMDNSLTLDSEVHYSDDET